MTRRLPALLVSLLVASTLLLVRTPAPAAAATCASTSQAAYSVTVCITAPSAGSTVGGNTQTSATVAFTGNGPGVRRVIFNLDGSYLLTDFSPPYTFALPSAQWVDGQHTLSASALLRDGVSSSPVSMPLTFSNGVAQPPVPPADFVPRSTAVAHPVIAAAGDGPDGGTASDQVASLISGWSPNLALYLGDVYEKGSVAEFHNWYGATGWGALASITNPAIGNHEYEGGQATGYFNYWHQPDHYYSFTAGSWKVIALDSTSQFGQTAKNSDQYRWLETELSNAPACVMVYFHHPVYSIGPQGNTASMQDIWQLMVNSGVDLVLTGHDHSYQRWVPLDKNGTAAANGLTQFVVGTAGHGIQAFTRTDQRMAVGFDTSPAAYGALKMTLNPSGVGYLFADTNGTARDGGAIQCSGTSADTEAPTAVTGLTGNAPVGSRVELAWPASIDNVGINQYQIFRNGSLLASTNDTSYRDFAVVPGATYQYSVTAVDKAGNLSAAGNTAVVTTPADGGLLFADDFETGTLAKWTLPWTMTVDAAAAYAGSFGAREVTSGSPAFATTDLNITRTDLYYRVRFKVVTADTANEYLLRLRNANTSLFGVYVTSSGKLAYRNDVAGMSNTNGPAVTAGVWHEVQVHLKIAGAQGLVETWFDGAPVPQLTKTEDLGTTGVNRLQIGDNATSRSHQAVFDDVAASLSFIVDNTPPPPDTLPPSAPGAVIATATAPDRVTLSWGAATDNLAVTAYDLYRSESSDPGEGLVLYTTVPASPTNLVDVVAPNTTYQYQVRARDAADNVGPPSASALVTTPPLPTSGTFTFNPVADSYVDDSAATTNYGTATSLRIDNSPQQISYLRFDLNGIGGAVSQVKLRLYAQANGSKGCNVLPVASNSWGETTLTWSNAPARGASVATCAAFTNGSWVEVDLTSANLVSGNGPVSLAITNPSSTSTRFDSREAANPPQLIVVTAPPDTQKPTAPANLVATANGSTSVNLSWEASTDNVAVTAYDIVRGGTVAASVNGSTLSYADMGLQPQTGYLYRVIARDAAGNASDPSNDAIVTTDPAPTSGTFTFNVAADSYVDDSAPNVNYGTATSLRIDNSPQQISYLRFDLSGVAGSVSSVTLRLHAQAKGTKGCDVLPVSSNSWGETTLTWSNAPARGTSVASCAGFNANSWVEVGLPTSMVTGNGSVSLAITNPSSTSTRFDSREASNAPQLVVVTTAPDTQKPTAPTNLAATANGSTSIGLTWSASTDNVAVTAYDIYRGATLVGSVGGSTLAFGDTGLTPSTAYSYTVRARDAAGNPSDPSNSAGATTDPAPTSGTFTFNVAADGYVDASVPTDNYGTATSLRIDNSPQQISYLRFDLSGVVGSVSSVTLRLYAQAKGTKGCNVLPVADNSWDEATLTWNTAPARGTSAASCASFNANTWVTVDLTAAALVTGNGSLSLAITNPSSTSTRFSSREGLQSAQLVVVTVPATP